MRTINIATLLLCATLSTNSFADSEWSGNIALEYRAFIHDPLFPEQHDNNASLSTQPEYYRSWDDGKQGLVFSPFVRYDQNDDERSHADIRELNWLMVAEEWELRVGIRKVFWGVTESQHLVDIINQTDGVENPDGEDKLGQPMINFALIKDWGTTDFFILPWFRERTLPGEEGRLRAPFPVDEGDARYESDDEEKHVDYAVRWSYTVDIWDIAVSHFSGTNRDPLFIPKDPFSPSPTLVPYYTLIDQTGLELQATYDEWLLKLELISRDDNAGRYTATTLGFENTLVGILDSQADLGLLAEYSFDDRNSTPAPVLANDLMLGTRLTLNDTQSSELLTIIVTDLDNQSRMFIIEGSRRIGNAWKASLEARLFNNVDAQDRLAAFDEDDHFQFELAWYF